MKRILWLALLLAALMPGCGGQESGNKTGEGDKKTGAAESKPAAGKPDKQLAPESGAGADTLVFWHILTQDSARILEEVVNAYNATNPPMKVAPRNEGNYTTLFQKARATISTGKSPDLVVAYPSMVVEYIEMGAAVAFDDYIADPKIGLTSESLADISPALLANCHYPAYGNKIYSFPFTKSVLMLYANTGMLQKAGFDRLPETWKEFQEQCLGVKSKLGKKGYALSVDASTFDAMVFSFGGGLIAPDRKTTLLGEAATVRALQTLTDLAKTGAAYQIDRESYGDRQEFSAGQCAFLLRSSTTRPYLEKDIENKFNWDMGMLPHGEGVEPVTVHFGADIAVLKTSPERQKAAWAFVKYFSSPEVTAKWGIGTGYLPVRHSALETAVFKDFLAKTPRNRRLMEALAKAKAEPDVLGWQAVRGLIEQAESMAIGGRVPAETLARELAKKADDALAQAAGK